MSELSLAADGETLRLLHTHAHPDDESSKGAASTAKYASQGVEVMVATFTGGERGDVLNPQLDKPEIWQNLATIRQLEMAKARHILGVEHVSLGFIDSGFPQGDPLPPVPADSFAAQDPKQAAAGLVEVIRSFRPHVLTTYDEKGGYPHPDHVQCHRVAMAALELAARPDYRPELGEAWQVPKVYYQMTLHRKRWQALNAACEAAGVGSPYAKRLASWQDFSYEHRITTSVRCGEFFPVRDEALRAHATQIAPDDPFWFATPVEIQQAVWPTEEFQLVYSAVPVVLPEDDLFAGLRPEPPKPASLAKLIAAGAF